MLTARTAGPDSRAARAWCRWSPCCCAEPPAPARWSTVAPNDGRSREPAVGIDARSARPAVSPQARPSRRSAALWPQARGPWLSKAEPREGDNQGRISRIHERHFVASYYTPFPETRARVLYVDAVVHDSRGASCQTHSAAAEGSFGFLMSFLPPRGAALAVSVAEAPDALGAWPETSAASHASVRSAGSLISMLLSTSTPKVSCSPSSMLDLEEACSILPRTGASSGQQKTKRIWHAHGCARSAWCVQGACGWCV